MDSRSRRNMSRLNDELQDVQRIMVQNIDDVLQRGETLSGKITVNWKRFMSYFLCGSQLTFCVSK